MDELIIQTKDLLDKMGIAELTEVKVDFHYLAKIYQMLNMMHQISNITRWCDNAYE